MSDHSTPVAILGCGYSALIAATVFPDVPMISATPPAPRHSALLRFRTDAVSKAFRIPFQPVLVRKGIVGAHARDPITTTCTVKEANLYALKTRNGHLAPNDALSIWNLDPVVRYIAPPDFYERALEAVNFDRRFIQVKDLEAVFATADSLMPSTRRSSSVSTLPMDLLLKCFARPWDRPGGKESANGLRRAAIRTYTWDLSEAFGPIGTYQTLYFPHHNNPIYRASLTGPRLIVEAIDFEGDDRDMLPNSALRYVLTKFGLLDDSHDASGVTSLIDPTLSIGSQSHGKIEPVSDEWRRATIHWITTELRLWSLGRYAVWKNLLLDDVLADAWKIREMISRSDYEQRLRGDNGLYS